MHIFTDTCINHCYLLPNFSFGFNTLLYQLPATASFLILDEDYPSIIGPIVNKGFKHHKIVIKEGFEDEIMDYCHKKSPDYFCFSMVQYISGIKMNPLFIKQLKKQFPEICIIVDATQYLGVEEFRFRESGIDILIASCYKWLHAGDGSAIMLMNEETEMRLNKNFKSTPVQLTTVFEPGHLNMVTMGVLQRAIEIHEITGVKAIENHIKELSVRVKKELLIMGVIDPWIGNREHSSIFNIDVNKTVYDRLRAHNIITSLRGNGIRISFAHYNNFQDFEELQQVLWT